MRVLVACEFTGTVSAAFRKLGHYSWSCDLLPTEHDWQFHTKGDIREVLAVGAGWDLMIAHPPCRYLSASGLHWNLANPERGFLTKAALDFVTFLMNAPIKRICVENPTGRIGTAIRPADQYIQPYEFGHDASKKTGLWLKNLPKLVKDPAKYIQPRIVNGKKRWANQTDSGQNRLAPSEHRAADRARTYQGIADAMAEQWGQEREIERVRREAR